MVEVRVVRREGTVWELACAGHAGFGEIDLVCAAVSALTGAVGLGFQEILGSAAELEVEDGVFRVAVKGPDDREQVLLQTVTRALEQLAEHYPGFIRFEERH